MNAKSRICGSLLAALLMSAGSSFAQMGGADVKMGGRSSMMESMKKGMTDMQAMPMSGDVDKDFAMMMRMHHQQALEMGAMELKDGKDAKMKQMARKIIDAQRKEIKEFDAWLAKHK